MKKLRTFAIVSLGIGIGFLGIHAALQNRTHWNPIMLTLPTVPGAAASGEFRPPEADIYEVQLETDLSLDKGLFTQIVGTKNPSSLDISWTVKNSVKETVAQGNVKDYLYIAPGPRSTKAKWRRVLLSVPFDRNDQHWRSWGLTGEFTGARGVGQFRGEKGATYYLEVASQGNYPKLKEANARMVVRRSRRSWNHHYEALAPLAYCGLLLIALGGGLMLLSLTPIATRTD
ncbi:MAG: hypothetical protein AAF438_17480 [Pseudomonadota bacterium]